jgi:hypothetical protein
MQQKRLVLCMLYIPEHSKRWDWEQLDKTSLYEHATPLVPCFFPPCSTGFVPAYIQGITLGYRSSGTWIWGHGWFFAKQKSNQN